MTLQDVYYLMQNFSQFHTSSKALQLPGHTLYPKVDFTKIEAGKYGIVDPVDPAAILYVSEKEYLLQVRVHLSQDVPLVVLCRPGDKPVAPHPQAPTTNDRIPSQNSPITGLGVSSSSKEKKRLGIPELFPPRTDYFEKDFRSLNRKTSLDTHWPKDAKHPWTKFLSWHVSQLSKWSQARDGKGGVMVAPRPEAVLSLVKGWGLDLNFRLGGPLDPPKALAKALVSMAEDLIKVLKTRGPKALILKMKNTLFFMDRWVGGTMNDNPFLLGEPVGLARSGLPRIIPLVIRRRIAAGDVVAIRLMQSVLNGYKVFEGPYDTQDLASITGPLPYQDPVILEEFRNFCSSRFWPYAKELAMSKHRKELFPPVLKMTDKATPYIPLRAGPNGRVGLLGAHFDAVAWDCCPVNWPLEWAKHVGDVSTQELFSRVNSKMQEVLAFPATRSKFENFETSALALLREPAGKVRPIAIVDYWTQRLMKPVHDWMMSVLSCFPTDATFQQEESLEGYVRYTKVGNVEKHYSIDLKSATDLIPITLYQALFEGVWGKETTELWIALLTDRWFRVPHDDIVSTKLKGSVIKYGRGQPMGTLSSWASMALVHHALELFSAWKAEVEPETFFAYRVLGDDNVTGDARVARAYLEVTESLGVPTSPAKTLEGKLFTFASQKYSGMQNLSPLSLKEELGVQTTSQRLELALRAVRRGWLVERPTVARFLRLLLRRNDYVKASHEWTEGKLGTRTQAALVSAFGLAGRMLSSLGFQKSGSIPFLLAVQGRVQALAGNQGSLDGKIVSYLRELDLLLATVTARRAVSKLRDQIKILKDSHKRFTKWRTAFNENGLLPREVRVVKKKETFNMPKDGFPYERCGKNSYTPIFPLETMQAHDTALWAVIWDTYAALWTDVRPNFLSGLMELHAKGGGDAISVSVVYNGEVLAGPRLAPDRTGPTLRKRRKASAKKVTAEVVSARKELEEDLITLTQLKDEPASQILQQAADQIDQAKRRAELREELLQAERDGLPVGEPHPLKPSLQALESGLDPLELCDYVLHTLGSDEDTKDPTFDPWRLVDLLFERIGRLPILPEFKTLSDLEPDRSPRAVDLQRSWVRSMAAYNEIMRYIPLAPDFLRQTQFGYDIGSLTLRDEALLSVSPRAFTASQGKRGPNSVRSSSKKRKKETLAMGL